jgi:hypothetical protein
MSRKRYFHSHISAPLLIIIFIILDAFFLHKIHVFVWEAVRVLAAEAAEARGKWEKVRRCCKRLVFEKHNHLILMPLPQYLCATDEEDDGTSFT